MAINRWEPFRDLLTMRDTMDRLFQETYATGGSDTWWPRMEVTEDDSAYRVRLAIPGVKPEDVDLRVEQQVLTVRGEIRPQAGKENQRTLHQEHTFGTFTRSVALPGAVDTEQASAQFEHGMLTITLPKHAAARPRRIPIGQSGQASGRVVEGQSATGQTEGAPKETAQGEPVGKEAQEVPLRP
jgi:HSP20 family protein